MSAGGVLPPVPVYLADTSALMRMRIPTVAAFLGPAIANGHIATCGVVDLQMLFSARSHADLVTIRSERRLSFPLIPIEQQDFDRAIDIMEVLASVNKHRSARLPDLLIAAVAGRAGLTILHYDSDFDHIASVTGQATRWVAHRGTLEE